MIGHFAARIRWRGGRWAAASSAQLSDPAAGVVAAAASVTAGGGSLATVAAVTCVGAFVAARDRRSMLPLVVIITVVVSGAAVRRHSAVAALDHAPMGRVAGWSRVVTEPQPIQTGVRVLLEFDGHRYESWVRGRAMKLRVLRWRGGEQVRVVGRRLPLSPQRQQRVAWEHIVGQLEIDYVTDVGPANAADRASNRVRRTIEVGAAQLPSAEAALLRGLVIGDDRDQPDEMIDRFRRSGLSHLTAVSGQNVTFLLIALGPLLERLRPWWRWVATLIAIGWFVSLTRFEPSIVRAGAMAAISATAFVSGRERSPFRLLCLAVTALVIVDPLIVGSVGFWLSVGATGGVIVAGPTIAAGLRPLGVLADPIGVTLGAQVGVIVPALLVFGTLPLVSIPANLLAVPVAGFAMLYGLPAALFSGLIVDVAPALAAAVMVPCRLAVRWVDLVAALGARLEPDGATVWWGWAVVASVASVIFVGGRCVDRLHDGSRRP